MNGLFIPNLPDDVDLLRAALAYAEAGWYVGPTAAGDVKNPGSILGARWQDKTSRDRDQIVAWFAGTSAAGLFLHVGRSGGVVMDVDHPKKLPKVLIRHLVPDALEGPPYQATRPDAPGRGHYPWLQPPGRTLGNSRGGLGDEWGEIRGYNGVIIVQPTAHPEGGEYRWLRAGPVPMLPDEIAGVLPDMGMVGDAASEADVKIFLETHAASGRPALMKAPMAAFAAACERGASRHESAVTAICWLMREARLGLYPARPAAMALWQDWRSRYTDEEAAKRPLNNEFASMLAWAVGQAEAADQDERRDQVRKRLEERDEARKAAAPPPVGSDAPVDPRKYFLDKTIPGGADISLMADDVLSLGPLAIGRDDAFWEYTNGVWRRAPRVVRHRMVHLLGSHYQGKHTTNTEHVVEARVPVIECDPIPSYWNVRNGLLDWRSGVMHPHSPDIPSTVQFPWAWDASADCPMFDKFLDEVLHEDYQVLAWQMIAYLLYSGNPLQTAFLLFGSGSNGKGTLLRVLGALLGRENLSAVTLTSLNKNKFSAVSMFGAIANLAGDIDATFQEETAMFKALTGEDEIEGERKYGARFMFRNWAVPVFTANKIPGSADTGHGYTRRWQVIKFERTITKTMPGLSEILAGEVAGIATRARSVLADLMVEGAFTTQGKTASGRAEFLLAIDQVRQWTQECCEIAEGTHFEYLPDLYKSYRTWAIDNGIGPLKSPEFALRLENSGYIGGANGRRKIVHGLRVIDRRMLGVPRPNDDMTDPWEE